MDKPPPRSLLWPWLLLTGGPTLLITAYFTVPLGSFGPHHPALSWTVFGVLLMLLAGLLLYEVQSILLESQRGLPALTIPLLAVTALLVFAGCYLVLAQHPGEFAGLNTRIDALYFTITTVATVGYGDIVPVSQTARVIVMTQILYTLVFLTAGATAVGQRLRGRLGERARRRRGGSG
ncbi:ion channel [Kitasatospora sp. NBC_01287]|uniref:potassium channel family protein n=1 Tax=Kitasatospora sp. NBC_01287 TaxID=2903573 RepID=UPI002258D08E|nr:ion channel [Kitasatospora sp. NBC_01287]MCX4747698.1 ion channel [Kitasatospora sp. NBC_01287]